MTWFRIDDGWHNHPKVLAAGNAAAGLWARCGAYCAQQLTDGFVPAVIARSYGNKAEIAKLVAVGLWEPAEGGWRMPDYADYNPSAEKVKAERVAAAERQRKMRESRRDNQRDSRGESRRDADGQGWLQNDDEATKPRRNSRGATRAQDGAASALSSEDDATSQRDFGVSHTTPSRPVPNNQSSNGSGRKRDPRCAEAIALHMADLADRGQVRNATGLRKVIERDQGGDLSAWFDSHADASPLDGAHAILGTTKPQEPVKVRGAVITGNWG